MFLGGQNSFTGPIPVSLSNASQLQFLDFSSNGLTGTVPQNLASLQGLVVLAFEENSLGKGEDGDLNFLSFIANCTSLEVLRLYGNSFGGVLPNSIANLSTKLQFLTLGGNMIHGYIPIGIGNLINLTLLRLDGNYFGGTLPDVLGKLQKLVELFLHNNKFSGSIPSSLGNLTTLTSLFLDENKFEGTIPPSLGNCQNLHTLNLSRNNLTGTIPKQVLGLSSLSISLVMSHNFLIGALPFEVGNLIHLGELDLSENRLSELLQSTNCFSENNLIGSGSFGSVYKGILPRNGAIVAVKVLNLQQQGASNSFINECNALRSIRHRNLLKIISACSSIDHEGNDFKSLIFEFMCNGSLDQWLHPKDDVQHQSKRLNFIQRLNIAIDVAYALEYLHHQCQTPIIHCDLKPSNILLDEDMTAHVGDFGLVNFLFETSNNPSKSQSLSIGLKGSIGYIPPEYAMGGQVSPLGDIYSYGILLLEMFIGKRPIDEMFKDGLSIHKFATMALQEYIMDIVDPSMFFVEDEEDANDDIEERTIMEEDPHVNNRSRIKECLISVFEIGLSCSKTSPDERMPANVVVNEINAIRDTFLQFKKETRRRTS